MQKSSAWNQTMWHRHRTVGWQKVYRQIFPSIASKRLDCIGDEFRA